jgi:hypothetical protein
MIKTHQIKLRQSCRKYRAIKAADLVPALRMTRKRQMQRRNKINHATSAPHAPHTSHTHTTKQKSAIMKTNQINLRQSCREYRAFEAGDSVAVLRMTRARQMQRRNKINHATSAQHAPHTLHIHSTKPQAKFAVMKTHQRKRRQSCRKYRAIKAADLVPALSMTRKRQMQRRNNINHATFAPHAPRTSHTHTTKTNSAMMKTHQLKLRQSCREYRAIKAADFVAVGVLCMTRKHQMQRRNKKRKQDS